MRRQRTTTILVLAILHLVGGGIGLLSSCYSLSMLGITQMSSAPPTTARTPANPPSSSDILRYYAEHAPGYWVFQIGSLAVDLLLDIMLLAAGVGLLKVQPWARTLSLVYAPLSILFHIAVFIYQIVFLAPLIGDAYAQYPAIQVLGAVMQAVLVVVFFVSLLVCIYPVVVLVLLLRPATAAAFRGELPAREGAFPEDEEAEAAPWQEPPPRSDKFRL